MPRRRRSNLSRSTIGARRNKARRLSESASDREKRLLLHRTRVAIRRSLETEDEREARLSAARARRAKTRAAQVNKTRIHGVQAHFTGNVEKWTNNVRSGLSNKASLKCTNHAVHAMTEPSGQRHPTPTTSAACGSSQQHEHQTYMISMARTSNDEGDRTIKLKEEECLEPIEFVSVDTVKEEPEELNEEEVSIKLQMDDGNYF